MNVELLPSLDLASAAKTLFKNLLDSQSITGYSVAGNSVSKTAPNRRDDERLLGAMMREIAHRKFERDSIFLYDDFWARIEARPRPPRRIERVGGFVC